MTIIEEYTAIARRLRELHAASPKGAREINNLERWRDLARETAREYIESRRRDSDGGTPSSSRLFENLPMSPRASPFRP
jgi:hypothetical protein